MRGNFQLRPETMNAASLAILEDVGEAIKWKRYKVDLHCRTAHELKE